MNTPNSPEHDHKASAPDILPTEIESLLAAARERQQTVVVVTGVFDVLHREHLAFLQKAKAAGDVLIVGIEADSRVRELKGEGRPVNGEQVRREQVSALQHADGVFILPDAFFQPSDYQRLIHHLRPQIMAVSSHTPHLDKKRALLAEVGGVVQIVHQHDPSISTTQLLQSQSF